jgi:hypothetical protein
MMPTLDGLMVSVCTTTLSVNGPCPCRGAFVIVTPEYNHSYPASVKALIDWHFTQWTAKPVAFVGYGRPRLAAPPGRAAQRDKQGQRDQRGAQPEGKPDAPGRELGGAAGQGDSGGRRDDHRGRQALR